MEHIGFEPGDTLFPTDPQQVLDQDRREALALIVLLDHEGDLRYGRGSGPSKTK